MRGDDPQAGTELAKAIAAAAVAEKAAVAARAGVERLTSLVAQQEMAVESVKANGEMQRSDYVVRLAEAALSGEHLRPQEHAREVPLAIAAAEEQLATTRAALANVEATAADAEYDLKLAKEKEKCIHVLLAREILPRVERAKHAHDAFIAQARILSEIADHFAVTDAERAAVRSMEFKAQNMDRRLPTFPVRRHRGGQPGKRFGSYGEHVEVFCTCRKLHRQRRARPRFPHVRKP